jgi:hypothetical protein
MLPARFPVLTMSVALGLGATAGCPRTPPSGAPPDAGFSEGPPGSLVCVEQPDGCVFCAGKEEQRGAFLEPDQSRPFLCDPADDESCVEFCSQVTPSCALPWRKTPGCVVDSDLEFRRALFNLRAADRPEVTLAGRVIDDGGRRVEGARVKVWLNGGAGPGLVPLSEEVTGKEGTFKTSLRSGPWSYSVRVTHPEHATSIVDRLPAERLDRAGAPRVFRMGAPQVIRGRILDVASGLPVPGAVVHAVRTVDDVIQVGEGQSGEDGSFAVGGLEPRRYVLKISKFGWQAQPVAPQITAPAQRITLKLAQRKVIRGSVVDAAGEAEPSATVAAVLTSAPGATNPPIFWTTDPDGRFAEDHFLAGTYYLWARRGDMLAYPPSRIELGDNHVVEVRIALSYKGARVTGRIVGEDGRPPPGGVSVELISRSPLSFPRNPVAKSGPEGRFMLAAVLPGRCRFSIKTAGRPMAIVKGPREVEVPIEPGSTVALEEAIVVARPRMED